MKLYNTMKYAVLGALALGIAATAGTASAQVAVEFEAGIPETITFDGEVSNTINADVTAPVLGTFGAIRSNNAGEQATFELAPDGTVTTAAAGDANMVEGTGSAAGIVDIAGAFNSTVINVSYSNGVNLTCALCTDPAMELELVEVTDNLGGGLAAGTAGTSTVYDVGNPAGDVVGNATTTAGGALTFNIGLTIQTSIGPDPYESGDYAGSFEALIQY